MTDSNGNNNDGDYDEGNKKKIMVTADELCARPWAKYNGSIYLRLIPTLSGTYYYCHSKWEVNFLSPFF